MDYASEKSKRASRTATKITEAFVTKMVSDFSTDSTDTPEEAFDVVRTLAYVLAEASTTVYLAMSMQDCPTVEDMREASEEEQHADIKKTLDAVMTDVRDAVRRVTGVSLKHGVVECSRDELDARLAMHQGRSAGTKH